MRGQITRVHALCLRGAQLVFSKGALGSLQGCWTLWGSEVGTGLLPLVAWLPFPTLELCREAHLKQGLCC